LVNLPDTGRTSGAQPGLFEGYPIVSRRFGPASSRDARRDPSSQGAPGPRLGRAGHGRGRGPSALQENAAGPAPVRSGNPGQDITIKRIDEALVEDLGAPAEDSPRRRPHHRRHDSHEGSVRLK